MSDYSIIRPKRGTANQWTSANTILKEGEIGLEAPASGIGTGLVNMKVGDGATPWKNLPYAYKDLTGSIETTNKEISGLTDEISELTEEISEKANKTMLSDAWNSETTYAKNSYCIYNNILWRCVAVHSGQVPQEGTYWTQANVGEDLRNVALVIIDNYWTVVKYRSGFYVAYQNYNPPLTVNFTESYGSAYLSTNSFLVKLPKSVKNVIRFNARPSYLGGGAGGVMQLTDDTKTINITDSDTKVEFKLYSLTEITKVWVSVDLCCYGWWK